MNIRKLAAMAALTLTACGGGLYGGNVGGDGIDTTGADVPANFTSAPDAAKAAAMIASLVVPGGITAKATTTTPCGSGYVTFTTDESTAFADDGRHEYAQCDDTIGSDHAITNGVTVDHCNSTASNNTVCTNDSVSSGENGVPFTFEQRSSTADTILRFLTTGVEIKSGSTTTDIGNGVIESENLLSHKSIATVNDNLSISTTTQSNGSLTATVSGAFGLNNAARSTANCISGRMTVSTPGTLTLDNNENFTGGQLHFTSDSGNTADVTFHGDGSVSASFNGGLSQNISKAVLATYCSVN